jgi:hypothetical protein
LLDLIKTRPFSGRGERKRLAEILNCQMAFITHVLSGEKDFNHEQLLKIATYLDLNETEKEFFLVMLSYNRAGTKALREFYKNQLLQKKEDFKLLKNRLQETQSLNLEDQAKYYSHWLYGAIHMASTIPALQTVPAIAAYFNLDHEVLLPILEFLNSRGLIVLESGRVVRGNAHLYIGKDSPLEYHHHAIWRVKALQGLTSPAAEDFRFSMCFSAAEKDWPLLREKMVEAINDCMKIIRPSKEEKLGLLCVDFQGV